MSFNKKLHLDSIAMRSIKIISVSIFLLCFYPVYAQIKGDKKQNDSLDDSLNAFIRKEINSRPPIIEFQFYYDTRRKHDHKILMFVNDQPSTNIRKSRIEIDTLSFMNIDSISFCLIGRRDSIFSSKVSYKTFLHGGTIIFGIVTNYRKERTTYLEDSGSYLEKNEKNYLYNVLNLSTRSGAEILNTRMTYVIIKSNTSALIRTNWIFNE